jgi:membrane-associated phospholipid phosphatase
MTARQLPWTFAVLAVISVFCVFVVDGPTADALRGSVPAMRGMLDGAVTVLETVFGFGVSKFASGLLVTTMGLVLLVVPARRRVGWMFLFVGTSQVMTRLVAGVLKNVFLRTRPFQGEDLWFVDGGSSFPSGHAAHFWGFYFALAVLFPRWRVPLLILPVFTSIARVLVNDHYVSDVIASAAIGALVTYGLALAYRRRVSDSPSASDTPR